MKTIGIIGGGAAGMMAAISASYTGAEVMIFEHKSRVGAKILSTGNGKCNLTNVNQDISNYHGNHPEFAEAVFEQFGLSDTLPFFLKLGIYTKNRNGGLYPYSEQASAVLDCLRMELDRCKIKILTDCRIRTIEKKEDFFQIETQEQGTMTVDRLIIAAGSKAAPNTGSDGSGYKLAKKFGISVIKPLPALTQLKSNLSWFKGVSGVRCDALLTLLVNGDGAMRNRGELQLTDYGISGIPTFQISGMAARALEQKEEVVVQIDFFPDYDRDGLSAFLHNRIQNSGHKTCEEMLTGLFHKKLIAYFLRECGFKTTRSCDSLSKEELFMLCEVIKATKVPIEAANDETHAQTCSGGIDTNELTKNCEAKKVKGLYFAGEIIDIDGLCGGYNLQWAWSSGYVAGKSAGND